MRKALAALVAGSLTVAALTAGALALTPDTASAQEAVEGDNSTVERHTSLEDVLGELVDEGVITQEQADVVAERLRENAPDRRLGHHRGAHLEIVAQVLDMEVSDLADALRDGQTIAEIAGDQTQSVIDALVDEAADRLADAVEDDRLTEEEADARLTEITERITAMVTGEGRPGPHHRPSDGPFGGPGAEEIPTDA